MEKKETKKGEKTMQVEIKERYINPYAHQFPECVA